jgi:putative phage-type endonuclease
VRILKLQQNTPEWYALRPSKIGASDAASITGKNPYKTPFMVWEEKLLGKETPINEFMQRGIDMEPEAREWISNKHNTKYETVCAEDENRSWRIASLDGWDGKVHVEIKCPTLRRLKDMQNGIVPEYWIIQVQHQMIVSGCAGAYLLGYSPEMQVEIFIERDEEVIAEIQEKEEQFYENYMLTGIAPPLCSLDIEKSDHEMSWMPFIMGI